MQMDQHTIQRPFALSLIVFVIFALFILQARPLATLSSLSGQFELHALAHMIDLLGKIVRHGSFVNEIAGKPHERFANLGRSGYKTGAAKGLPLPVFRPFRKINFHLFKRGDKRALLSPGP